MCVCVCVIWMCLHGGIPSTSMAISMGKLLINYCRYLEHHCYHCSYQYLPHKVLAEIEKIGNL